MLVAQVETDGLSHVPLSHGNMTFDRFHQPRLFTETPTLAIRDISVLDAPLACHPANLSLTIIAVSARCGP